jgi:hypothetical protein
MGLKRAVLSRFGSTPRCAPPLDELNESTIAEGRPKGPLTGVRGSVLAAWWFASGVDGNRIVVDGKCEIALERAPRRLAD